MNRSASKFGLSVMYVVCLFMGHTVYAAGTNPTTDATVPPTEWQDSLVQAFTHGTPSLDMRYRYENVQQEGLPNEASANTLRTRLGYETGVFKDFKLKAQVENIMPFGPEHYNDTTNGLTTFPTVADPRTTAQLYEGHVVWTGLPQSSLTFGRQAMAWNNERWVGIADWRQLGQTFDALTAQNHSIQDVNLNYSYVFHVNRVNGPRAGSATAVSYDTHAHLLNADYTPVPGVKLIGYGYLIDISNAPTLSSKTFGTRIEVKQKVCDKANAIFNGEYARQTEYGNNPASIGYNYYLVEPGINMGSFTTKVGYESMGGNGTTALQTPFFSVHGFNGWAEKFGTTPATGLDHVHIAAEYKSPSYNDWLDSTVAKFIWYSFYANSSNVHYGNEYDIWLGQTFFKHYTLAFQYAQYNSDKAALTITDTHKIVASLQVKF